MIKQHNKNNEHSKDKSAKNSNSNSRVSKASIRSDIQDDDDKSSVKSVSTVRSNISKKEPIVQPKVHEKPHHKTTFTKEKPVEDPMLISKQSIRAPIPKHANQKDVRIKELEDSYEVLMRNKIDLENNFNEVKSKYNVIQDKSLMQEADIYFLEDEIVDKYLNSWIGDAKIDQFVQLNQELTTLQSHNEKLLDLGNEKFESLQKEYTLMQDELIKRTKVNTNLRKMNQILVTKLNKKKSAQKEYKERKVCNLPEHDIMISNIDKLKEMQEYQIQVEKEYEEFKKSSLIRYKEIESERILREAFFKKEIENITHKLETGNKFGSNLATKIIQEKKESNDGIENVLINIPEFKWLQNVKVSPEIVHNKCIEQITGYIESMKNLEEMVLEKNNMIIGMNNKLQDKENCLKLHESRIQTLEKKYKVYSDDESEVRWHKLHLEAEIVKMASKLKDMEVVQNINTDLKLKHSDKSEENRLMSKEIELLRIKNKSLNEQLYNFTRIYD